MLRTFFNKSSRFFRGCPIRFRFSEHQPPSTPNPEIEKITKMAKEINLLYLKKPIEPKKAAPVKVKKTKDEINRDTNQNVISREIGNDFAQIPLKFLAFYCSNTANQGPFWAELTRSSIDAINHAILYITNYVPTGPSSKYPYGIDKIKNFVVMIPAGLFFVFGSNIIYNSLKTFLTTSYKLEEFPLVEDGSFLTLGIYLVSILIESCVVYKNINDVASLQGEKNSSSIISKLKTLTKKKDPLLEAVLFENFITFNSTLIPMIVSVINMFFPHYPFAELGSAVIGIIQWYLGYQLLTRNIPNLIGRGVDEDILQDILLIIKKNPYVLNLSEPKGVNTGTHKFRFSANIVFNQEKVKKELFEDLEERFDRITFEQKYGEREDELSELISNMPNKIFNEIRIQQSIIEETIRHKYPDCEDCHLEIDTENHHVIDVDEYTKDHLNIETHLKIKYFEDELKELVEGDFMFSEKKKKALRTEETYPFLTAEHLKKNYEFLFTEIDYDYIEENLCCNEDYRFEMIKNQLDVKKQADSSFEKISL